MLDAFFKTIIGQYHHYSWWDKYITEGALFTLAYHLWSISIHIIRISIKWNRFEMSHFVPLKYHSYLLMFPIYKPFYAAICLINWNFPLYFWLWFVTLVAGYLCRAESWLFKPISNPGNGGAHLTWKSGSNRNLFVNMPLSTQFPLPSSPSEGSASESFSRWIQSYPKSFYCILSFI